MKKLLGILMICFFIHFANTADAQVVKKTGHAIKKGAKKVGNETAELASKGRSKVSDKTYKDKVAPGGQTVFIDGHSRYYYVDERGKRQYVTEAELRPKYPKVKTKD
jgi:hypothetical protein